VAAVRATHPGEAVGEVAAFEIVVHHLGGDRAEEAVVPGEPRVIDVDEFVEVAMQQIPKRGVLRSARVIGLGGRHGGVVLGVPCQR